MSQATKQDIGVDNKVTIWTWGALIQADPSGVDLGVNYMEYVDRSIQFEGTFDGATVVWEGSNDGVNFHTLTDPLGNVISKLVPSITQITESAAHARPRVTGATINTNIVASLAARKQTK